MKKFLLILFCLFGYASYAQVGGIHYQPQSSYQGQRSYQSQPQQRVIRATAYSYDSYNNTYIKHPIKLIEYGEHGMVKYKIVEVCESTGYGVQWVKLSMPVPVSACMSMYSSNQLESQFTHKANVMGTIYYFDL